MDRATDVLSFPMFHFTPGQLPADFAAECRTRPRGLSPWGICAISLERVRCPGEGIRALGTSRELGYLTVHSVLHLLGYDHLDEGPMKEQMRAREEAIMAEIVL